MLLPATSRLQTCRRPPLCDASNPSPPVPPTHLCQPRNQWAARSHERRRHATGVAESVGAGGLGSWRRREVVCQSWKGHSRICEQPRHRLSGRSFRRNKFELRRLTKVLFQDSAKDSASRGHTTRSNQKRSDMTLCQHTIGDRPQTRKTGGVGGGLLSELQQLGRCGRTDVVIRDDSVVVPKVVQT